MFIGITSQINGGFAPIIIAHKSQLFNVPDSLSIESAVMTEPGAVALQSIFDNMPEDGTKVLVIGGGVIGNLLVQSIRALVPDCHISVIEPADHAANLALECGADVIVPANKAFDYTANITGRNGLPALTWHENYNGWIQPYLRHCSVRENIEYGDAAPENHGKA